MSNKDYPGNESFTITLTDLWYLITPTELAVVEAFNNLS